MAEITVQVPVGRDLGRVVEALRQETADERDADVFVSALNGSATITVRARAADEDAAEALERELRLRAHERLRSEGLLG